MPLPNAGKLVRDRIPEIIRHSGRHPTVLTLDVADMRAALELKLAEEIDELLAAPDASRLEELADVYEVILALAAEIDANEQTLAEKAKAKREKKGAFDDRLWLVDAGGRVEAT